VWLADLPGDKIRPIVVMTRETVIRYLHSVVAAPITGSGRIGTGISAKDMVDAGLLRVTSSTGSFPSV